MLKFITTPYVLIPICLVLWFWTKHVYERCTQREWLEYQNRVKETAIVSRSVMTPNETEFFGRLKLALPDFEVIPQVAMSALLDVALPAQHPDYWPIRKAFSQKTVDYVVCRKGTMQVITVVELDDRTHDTKQAKDAARDSMLAGAGIKTIRWDSRAKPQVSEIRREVVGLA
jgi:hypothetical protein